MHRHQWSRSASIADGDMNAKYVGGFGGHENNFTGWKD